MNYSTLIRSLLERLLAHMTGIQEVAAASHNTVLYVYIDDVKRALEQFNKSFERAIHVAGEVPLKGHYDFLVTIDEHARKTIEELQEEKIIG